MTEPTAKHTADEQGDVHVVALDKEGSERHRKWLEERSQRAAADHREWVNAVMEEDRAINREILKELRAIRALLDPKPEEGAR